MAARKRIAVIGGGWAGMAAAVELARASHAEVTVLEAAKTWGGRARGVECALPAGPGNITIDNGQHILIGAYTECRRLMEMVGVDIHQAFARMPLAMRYPDGSGIQFPDWPAPWDALAGIGGAKGWTFSERMQLLARATRWRLQGFRCTDKATVADLCQGLPRRLLDEFFDPLCISALNTPLHQASGQVFLRVLHDSLFAAARGSQFWLPRIDLGALFPGTTAAWLAQRGHHLRLGERVREIHAEPDHWRVDGQSFDAVVLATPAWEAARLANGLPQGSAWAAQADALEHTAIATVYAWHAGPHTNGHSLSAPLLALHNRADAPAQFVFDRGRLGGPAGLLAFVISTSDADRDTLQQQVLAQAKAQLGLDLQPLQTIVEKRATFACTPGLQRPGMAITPTLLACGDYVDGPYPATLEGAVRSGVAAAQALLALPQ